MQRRGRSPFPGAWIIETGAVPRVVAEAASPLRTGAVVVGDDVAASDGRSEVESRSSHAVTLSLNRK